MTSRVARVGPGVVYPGCRAEFVGQRGHAAKVFRTFGFRVRDDDQYHSNLIWLDTTAASEVDATWLGDAVRRSNGR
jgi:hypothetical protein